MDLGLNDRRAIVTGGSKGLGFAIAQELIREGATVRICARNPEEVAAAVDRLGEQAGGGVELLQGRGGQMLSGERTGRCGDGHGGLLLCR